MRVQAATLASVSRANGSGDSRAVVHDLVCAEQHIHFMSRAQFVDFVVALGELPGLYIHHMTSLWRERERLEARFEEGGGEERERERQNCSVLHLIRKNLAFLCKM